jgi:hypothetical protein
MSKMPKKQSLENTTTARANPAVSSAAAGADPAATAFFDDGDAGGAGDDSDADEQVGRARRFKEVWLVEDRKNARSVWTRVGAAFENADGSWNIRLSAVPVGGGRLNVRDPLPRERAVTA